tara:strand:- start:70 stop:918 length:849 start_codon:yes stop_codon:yes gene_type:complete
MISLKNLILEQNSINPPALEPPATYDVLNDTQKKSFDAWVASHPDETGGMDNATAYNEYGYTKWWHGPVSDGGLGHDTADGAIFDMEDGSINSIIGIPWNNLATVIAVLVGPGIFRGTWKGINRIWSREAEVTSKQMLQGAFPTYASLFTHIISRKDSLMRLIRKRQTNKETGAILELQAYLNGGKSFGDLIKATTKEEQEMLKQLRQASMRGELTVSTILKDITKPLLDDVAKGKITANYIKDLLGKNYKKSSFYRTALQIQYSTRIKYGEGAYKNAQDKL